MNPMTPACELMLQANFGGYTAWRSAFTQSIAAMADKPGKVMMCFDNELGKVVNRISEPGVSESAELLDEGDAALLSIESISLPASAQATSTLSAAVDRIVDQIDWTAVYARYQAAVNAASEPYALTIDDAELARSSGDTAVFDVRRAGVYAQARQLIAGAQWRDPADVTLWLSAMAASDKVLVYCVHGHEVSRAVALRLRAGGVQASFLAGGIESWASAGKPVAAKPS